MANDSEKQLKDFLKVNSNIVKCFILRTQGANSIIDNKKAINMAEVHIPQPKGNPNEYKFGGIREKYYDKLYKKYSKDFEGVKFSSGAAELL